MDQAADVPFVDAELLGNGGKVREQPSRSEVFAGDPDRFDDVAEADTRAFRQFDRKASRNGRELLLTTSSVRRSGTTATRCAGA